MEVAQEIRKSIFWVKERLLNGPLFWILAALVFLVGIALKNEVLLGLPFLAIWFRFVEKNKSMLMHVCPSCDKLVDYTYFLPNTLSFWNKTHCPHCGHALENENK